MPPELTTPPQESMPPKVTMSQKMTTPPGMMAPTEMMAPPFLLVLDARTMEEVARVEFPGVEFHRDVHGVFQPFD
jgi:hypothetical protein